MLGLLIAMKQVEKYGSAILREEAVPIEVVDDDIKALADDMIATMRAENGIGLAAEQVGRREALCVIEVPIELDFDRNHQRMNLGVDMPLVLINPVITASSDDMDVCEEGCLSFPGFSLPIKRPSRVSVRYLDLRGDNNEISVQGLVARAIQHEMDHLEGRLIIDHISKVKRLSIAGQLKKLKQETESGLAMRT